MPELIPFRWPSSWSDPAKIELLKSTPYNCAMMDDRAGPAVRRELDGLGIKAITIENAPANIIKDARWPQIQTGAHGEVDTGPTGSPWIDSNGYAVQAYRAAFPAKPVWLTEAPESGKLTTADHFRLAVADAAACSGHWIPGLDCPAWEQVARTQQFFITHKNWRDFRPKARLAVMTGFEESRRDFVLEVLNLLTRLYVPFEVIRTPEAAAAKKYSMVLNLDKRDASSDAWQLANEVRDQLGHRNDLVRLWNGSSLIAYLTAAPNGASDLLQLVNYAARVPGEAVTAAILLPYRSARIYTLEKPVGTAIELHPARSGVEVYLPPFAIYAAIELTR